MEGTGPVPTETQGEGGPTPNPSEEGLPPDLQCANRKYTGTDILANSEQRLLDILNTVWQRICMSLKLFHVAATADAVVHTNHDDDRRDVVEDWYQFNIRLSCDLFTANLRLVYTSHMSGPYGDDCSDDISYSLENLRMLRESTTLLPLELNNSKKVFEKSAWHAANYDHELMLADAMFVSYDVLHSMRSFLIYNKVLVVVKALRNLTNPQTRVPISDDAKAFIVRNFRKLSEKSANDLFQSLLLECRPQWVAPQQIEFIRRNTLSNPRIVNRT
jgi:nucleoside-diphosphate-sugar epimerase